LSWNQPIDQPTPGPGNIQARRPFNTQFPNVTSIAYYQSVGVGNYNSMQVSFQQKMHHGLFLTANYVWSHSLNDAPYDGGSNGPIPQDPLNRAADYANADNDIRSRLNLYGSYQLPFGPGRTFLNRDSFVNRVVLGGWQLNGIVVAQSGLPFTVTISGTATNTGASSSRVDAVPGVPQYPAKKTIAQWFNPAAFVSPTAYNYGSVSRNSLYGPRETNVDASLEKNTPLAKGAVLLFRVEFFNVLNHPQFVIPASTINSTGVGTITATSNSARQIQGALRISF
jgi:hypothetical protein